MTQPQRHIIQRQVFELNLPQQEGAYQFQQEWSRVFWQQVAPAMEQLFDRLAPPGTSLRLDRLEIDLGDLNRDDWQLELPRILAATIERELLKKRMDNSPSSLGQTPKTGAFFEKLVFFLENGRLPWWASPQEETELEAALLDALANEPGNWPENLRRALAGNPIAVERLLAQFGEAVLVKLAEQTSATFPILNELKNAVEKHLPTSINDQFKRAFWWAFFEKIPPNSSPQLALELLETALRSSLAGEAHAAVVAVFQATKTALLINTKAEMEHDVEHGTETNAGANSTDKNEAQPAASLPFLVKKMGDLPSNTLEEGEAIFVENAGLALLTPFMPQLFRSLGLLDGQQFVFKESCHRAIHLLEFIATGTEQPFEFALPLNKLLCGVAIEMPVERLINLTPSEKTEAETLLQSVIEHWPALKNTSQEGLREAFLHRSGKLTRKPSGDWLLQVERKTLDVLLDKLPWGFSLVKMPWMGEMLWVEWN